MMKLRAAILAFMLAASPALAANQASYQTPTTGPHSATDFTTNYLNPGLLAIATCNWGPTAPANGPGAAPSLYQCWADTSGSPTVLFKLYDGAQWIIFGSLNTSNHSWQPFIDSSSAFGFSIASTETFTANRKLTVVLNDADRQLSMQGDLTLSGAFAATFTFTGTTGVTFPTTGTLATLSGVEVFVNKTLTTPTINGAALSGTFTGAPTFSGNLTLSGVPLLTGLSSGTCTNGIAIDSGNHMIKVACPGAASSIQDGTTTITSGVSGSILGNASGVLTHFTRSAPTECEIISTAATTCNNGGSAANNGTYTTPAGALYLKIKLVGGGGGGAGAGTSPGAAGAGGNTTFSTFTASGGNQASTASGGAGASASGGAFNQNGGDGGNASSGNTTTGGAGGQSCLGGAGAAGAAGGGNGKAAAANSGSAGGGAGQNTTSSGGGGGGAGACVIAIISSPSASYSYGIGAAGTAGTGGTGGAGGGGGGAGHLFVEAFFN